MTNSYSATHNHVFLGEGHTRNERRTWMVIGLCSFMMVAEIVGGVLFGSIALVADGLHMSTHASALLLAALAYSFAGGMPTIGASASEPASWAIWRDLPAPSCWP
jgi:Co/Zn/Cd efflux system component